MIKKLLIISLMALISLFPVQAGATDDIRLVSSTTRADFPFALTFNIKAESNAPISRIRLRYTVDKRTYAPAYAEAWPKFTPSQSVSASWTWDMRTALTPPGAEITYWWVIEDSAGNMLTTSREKVSFDDDRYKWQKISSDMISLYWYNGNKDFAEDLLHAAVEAADLLGDDTGTPLQEPVEIYIYASYDDLRGSMVDTEEWTGGVNYTDFNVISIGVSTSMLDWGKKAIAHELGHAVTHQVLTSPYSAFLPTWLDEGLAMHAEGKQTADTQKALIKAVKNNSLATLKSLSGPFPADAKETAYAYAQSQSVVEYMLDKYGNDSIHEMLLYFNEGHTIDEALQKVCGLNTEGLDDAWRQHMLSLSDKASSRACMPDPALVEPIPALAYRGI